MPEVTGLDAAALKRLLTTFRDAVAAHSPVLDLLNVYPVPDGDTGTNMRRTLDAVLDELGTSDDDDLAAVCEAISHGSLMGARGNSGVILSQILRGITSTLRDSASADGGIGPRQVAAALRSATDGAYRAVMAPVEGTILTVVRESAEAAEAAASAAGATLIDVAEAARVAADDALDRTPDLLPVLREAGVVDAGGAGLVLLFDALVHVLTGRPVRTPDLSTAPPVLRETEVRERAPARHVAGIGGGLDVSEQRYEVMYLLDLDDGSIDELRARWAAIGDSIVVVGGEGTWNCHVHTNDIGGAIEAALDVGGRPSRIRVTDLFEEDHEGPDAEPQIAAPATCGVVAVASGPGLASLFASLGVAEVVTGGQTCNPSTAELLAAVEAVPADEVVVLPNNKNIIAVAEQVDALSSRTVRVVPTRTMPEGLSSLVVFDRSCTAIENRASMLEAIDAVASGEVTSAVRDSNSPVGPVSRGDWIGLVRDDGIVAVGSSAVEVAIGLLGSLLDAGREIVTIVTGEDAEAADTEQILAWIDDEHADLEVEVHEGGQPLYPYLFGVE